MHSCYDIKNNYRRNPKKSDCMPIYTPEHVEKIELPQHIKRAVIDDSRLHNASRRCDMCSKVGDLTFDMIYDGEGLYYHWVCDVCKQLLQKSKKS